MRSDAARRAGVAAAELLVAVTLATLLVSALQHVAPITGLGVVYLLAVLLIAIRRGLVAALATAVASVLALNYFFIKPVHRFTIADSDNVVALAVFLIVGVIVARLAADARKRAGEAEARAREAAAREAEAEMLAEIASLLLGGEKVGDHLGAIAGRVGRALGVDGVVRLELSAAPTGDPGEAAHGVPLRHGRCWLYLPRDAPVGASDLARVTEALGGIMDVAAERERLGAQAADAEAARRADVAKTAVLHAISHDLRSPLTAITAAADGLAADAVSAEERAELLSVVSEESARLARLVDDLLDLSRVQAGAVHPQLDWCDLRDVIGRAAESVSASDSAKVAIDLPDDLPLVRADAAQLERVFSNLLENALRFAPAGEPVRVRGGVGRRKVTIRVIDTGPGVRPPQRARIFEPFVRGRGGQGAGLGLAICRGFVEANGGQITLLSSTGRETEFAVSLPLVPQPVAAG